MAATSPLFDFDVSKYFASFKVPALDVDALMAAQRKNIEAVTAANQVALEGMGALVRRQSEIARKAAESYTAAVTDIVGEGTPEDKVSKQAEFARTAYDAAIANGRELSDMIAKTRDEAFGVINARVLESMEEMKSFVAARK